MPLRVLHVHSGNMYGGVETFLLTLARGESLCPAMKSSIALCFEGRLSQELRASGAQLYVVGKVQVSRPQSIRRARRAFARVLAETSFDVVVCHQAWPHAIFGPVVRSAGASLVLWLHTVSNGWHWLDLWARRTPPDLVVCSSKSAATASVGLHPGVPLECVHYPIVNPSLQSAVVDRQSLRADLGAGPHEIVIMQANRMEPWKGQWVCLEALALLRDVPGWTCWQAGGAQRRKEVRYLDQLRRYVTREGLERRVQFLGARTDMGRLFNAADIYCQPNTGPEPYPITLIEALSAGRSIVTTTIGGPMDIVDETCGLLVPPRDVAALAAALRRLIEDEATRTRLGRQALVRRRSLCDPATQLRRMRDVFAAVTPSAGVANALAAS